MREIRVLIVDDQVLFAKSLRVVLQGHGKSVIKVVGLAYDGKQAISEVERLGPDVVLMDVRMPEMDGVAAAGEIARRFAASRVVMLTTFGDDEYVHEALSNGAVGYLLKTIDPEELVSAVRAVHAGTFTVSPAVARRLVDEAAGTAERHRRQPEWAAETNFILSKFPILGRREAEVLSMVARNWSNREIADRLAIAEQTVKNYVSRVYEKLGVPDRAHAIRKVLEQDQARPVR